jgi:hypothetical protein
MLGEPDVKIIDMHYKIMNLDPFKIRVLAKTDTNQVIEFDDDDDYHIAVTVQHADDNKECILTDDFVNKHRFNTTIDIDRFFDDNTVDTGLATLSHTNKFMQCMNTHGIDVEKIYDQLDVLPEEPMYYTTDNLEDSWAYFDGQKVFVYNVISSKHVDGSIGLPTTMYIIRYS